MPIVSQNIRVRVPDHFEIGENSIIDDWCYFSTRVRVGAWSHIASGCSVAGGPDRQFTLGSYASVSSGAKIWCTSDDFVNDLVTILPPGADGIKENLITGDVSLGDYTAVGANSVIMPQNDIPEGVSIGALSFVPPQFPFEPWSVYAGIPIRLAGPRNRDSVMRQLEELQVFLRARS